MTRPKIIRNEDIGEKLIDDYLRVFGTFSIKNECYGRISLHVILGQALKNVHYQMGSRIIDTRTHMLLIKPQGTGKGAGYGFVKRMAEAIGLNFQALTESTDAGLIGTLIRNEEGEMIVEDGLLKSADIIGMEEASVLFDYTNDFSKKNMTYMQITMNPLADSSCFISKKLGVQLIEFKPHASFLLMTYPPDKLVDKLLKTGFIDRVIPIFEDVTLMDRLQVINKMSKMVNSIDKDDAEKEFENVAYRLNAIISKFQKGDIQITIPDEVHTSILAIVDMFALKILDASPKAREKLEHFISRLYETLMKLAIHHAILCKRTTLDISDALYARTVYIPIWTNLIISIESLLVISPIERLRRHSIIRNSILEYELQIKMGEFIKGRVWVRRPTMVKNLQPRWDNCSMETADSNLLKLEKTPEDKYETRMQYRILNYEKDKYFERKYFGGTAYLKKIKNM